MKQQRNQLRNRSRESIQTTNWKLLKKHVTPAKVPAKSSHPAKTSAKAPVKKAVLPSKKAVAPKKAAPAKKSVKAAKKKR